MRKEVQSAENYVGRSMLWTSLIACLGMIFNTACIASAITPQELRSDFFVQTAEGTPFLCGFEYKASYIDDFYNPGSKVAVQGSLNIITSSDHHTLILLQKIDAYDVVNGRLKHFDIASAHFRIGDKTVLAQKSECLNDAFCGAYANEIAIDVATSLLSGDLVIHLRRSDSLSDTSIKMSPEISTERASFVECLSSVVGQLR